MRCPICLRETLDAQGCCEACGADLGAVNVDLIRASVEQRSAGELQAAAEERLIQEMLARLRVTLKDRYIEEMQVAADLCEERGFVKSARILHTVCMLAGRS